MKSNPMPGTRPLRIVVLHQHYWPEIAATAQILADICEDLASHGHHVSVICGQPSYRQLPGAAAKLPSTETRRAVEIRRVWSYIPTLRSIPQRLASYGSYFGSSLLAALTSARPDVCFVMSTPPLLLGLSGITLQTLRGVPFVYSVQDLYPDIAIHLGVMKTGSVTARSVELATRLCFRRADTLVTLSHGMATRVAAKGIHADKVEVIANWADTSSVVPTSRDNEFAREHGLCEDFVVLYSGNLGLSQGLESTLEAAASFRDQRVRFVFVGDGNAKQGLEQKSRDLGLGNTLFLPPQPRERLAAVLSSCEVGLVTMKRGVGEDLVPSKLYGIMAAGKPVLAAVERSSEVGHVLERHDCGVRVDPESPDALVDGIRSCIEASEDQRASWGANGRAACISEYSRSSATSKYASILLRAANRGRVGKSRRTENNLSTEPRA